MRLIDADAFERAVMFSDDADIQDVIYRLRDFPTVEPQSEQKLWKERYEDLLEYFHGEDIILKDRKEFKAWLERCRWHVLECDKLARQLEAQPEIIHCKDCKYAEVADPEDGQDGYTCQFHRGSIWFSGSYCSWAEREENG